MYYYLQFSKDDSGGVAFCDDPSIEWSAPVLLENGEPRSFTLCEKQPEDYQSNNLGWWMMSARLRSLIEVRISSELVHWSAVYLKFCGRKYEYFIPHFPVDFDVLDLKKSKFVNGPIGPLLLKGHIDKKKVGDLCFFSIAAQDIRLVICQRLFDDIKNEKLTGIQFSKVPLS